MSKEREVVSLVGDDQDGWNVEVLMNMKVVVFACDSREAADELRTMISECSWFQIESR